MNATTNAANSEHTNAMATHCASVSAFNARSGSITKNRPMASLTSAKVTFMAQVCHLSRSA